MDYIDLSHPITQNTPVYPGDPPVITKQNNTVIHDNFCSHTMTLGTHVGTHIDAPAHMIENGKKIADFPIDKFIGRAIIINVVGKTSIDIDTLTDYDIQPDDIVLIRTDRDKIYNQEEYFTQYPILTEKCAERLVQLKVKMIGLDQASVDYSPFQSHKILLGNNILIIENLTNLSQIQHTTCMLYAVPINTRLDAAPVRVVAICA